MRKPKLREFEELAQAHTEHEGSSYTACVLDRMAQLLLFLKHTFLPCGICETQAWFPLAIYSNVVMTFLKMLVLNRQLILRVDCVLESGKYGTGDVWQCPALLLESGFSSVAGNNCNK